MQKEKQNKTKQINKDKINPTKLTLHGFQI